MSYPFDHEFIDVPKLQRENAVDGRRVYTDGIDKFVSVTTALSGYNKAGIDKWKKRVGEEEAAKVSSFSTSRGTALHEACENYLKNVPYNQLEMMPHVKSLFNNMRRELNKIDRILCLETPLFSRKLRLAGTVDCIGYYDGILSIIDFKTSRKKKKREYIQHYFLQCACYAIMLEEMTGKRPEKLVLIIGVDEDNTSMVFEEPFNDAIVEELTAYVEQYLLENPL